GVAVSDLALRDIDQRIVSFSFLSHRDLIDGGFQAPGGEHRGDPIIEVGKDLGLAYIHRARVVDLVRQGVLLGEAAPVVGLIVVPVALHAPVTDPADETYIEVVRARRASRRMRCGRRYTTGKELWY